VLDRSGRAFQALLSGEIEDPCRKEPGGKHGAFLPALHLTITQAGTLIDRSQGHFPPASSRDAGSRVCRVDVMPLAVKILLTLRGCAAGGFCGNVHPDSATLCILALAIPSNFTPTAQTFAPPFSGRVRVFAIGWGGQVEGPEPDSFACTSVSCAPTNPPNQICESGVCDGPSGYLNHAPVGQKLR
jgi:hypothetical protein